MSKSKLMIGVLAAVCLALTLAACQPGGSATGSAGATRTPAPIHVPSGYQGIVQISFTSTTTYDQAVSILRSAGLRLQVPCPNPGPIVADPTPRPITQEDTFAKTYKLTAVGDPQLTENMLNQVASSPQVTSIDKVPPIECPLIP